MSITQLIYASEIEPTGFNSRQPLKKQLDSLLERAQRRNSEVSVTGILLFSGGHFLQVLEGHQRVLGSLFARIAADPRHRNVVELAWLQSPERLFGKWYMGLLNLDERVDLDPQLFNSFQKRLGAGLDDRYARSQVIELLNEFKQRLDCDQALHSDAVTSV